MDSGSLSIGKMKAQRLSLHSRAGSSGSRADGSGILFIHEQEAQIVPLKTSSGLRDSVYLRGEGQGSLFIDELKV